jgi:hypothetical protein
MKRIALIGVALVAALVVSVSCGFAGTTDASHCQYAKLFRGWQGIHSTIYLRLAITPRNPTACRIWIAKNFNGAGLLFRKKLGSGVSYCTILDKTSSQSVTIKVFADTAKAGQRFCHVWHTSWRRL